MKFSRNWWQAYQRRRGISYLFVRHNKKCVKKEAKDAGNENGTDEPIDEIDIENIATECATGREIKEEDEHDLYCEDVTVKIEHDPTEYFYT